MLQRASETLEYIIIIITRFTNSQETQNQINNFHEGQKNYF